MGGCLAGVGADIAAVEHIDGMDEEAGIEVLVGDGEEEFDALDGESGLFEHFTHNALLAGLEAVGEAAGQVEGSLGGVFSPPHDAPLASLVDDEGYGGGRRIEIVGEATSLTVLGLVVVLYETG